MIMPALRDTTRALLDDPGFRIHLIIYGAVNLLLMVINLLTNPGNLWFFWPLLGWGLGLIGHGFAAFQANRP